MIDTYDRFQVYEDLGLGAEEFQVTRRFTRPTEKKTPARTTTHITGVFGSITSREINVY